MEILVVLSLEGHRKLNEGQVDKRLSKLMALREAREAAFVINAHLKKKPASG